MEEVYIKKVEDTLISKPKENKWDNFFLLLENIDTSDFFKDRVQPPLDNKELF